MCQSSPLNEMCSESLCNLPVNVTKKPHVWPCLPKISHTDTVCHFEIYSKILFQLLQKWSKTVHWSCFEVTTTIASRSKKSAVFIILSLATRRCMFKTPFNDIYEHCLCIRSINSDAKKTGQSDFAEWESGLVSIWLISKGRVTRIHVKTWLHTIMHSNITSISLTWSTYELPTNIVFFPFCVSFACVLRRVGEEVISYYWLYHVCSHVSYNYSYIVTNVS